MTFWNDDLKFIASALASTLDGRCDQGPGCSTGIHITIDHAPDGGKETSP